MKRDPAQALYFGLAGQESFGWLHGAGRGGALGLVICGSFGREDLCLHRTLRHIAERAAHAGIPAIRFDYPGTGDSPGSEPDGDASLSWLNAIGSAIDLLRQRTGVGSVCLLGVRLGCLLAATVAAHRHDVAGLVAIAPVVSGRAYVRELRLFGSATEGADETAADDRLESGGFIMNRETQEGLKKLDLLKLAAPPSRNVLILERDDVPADTKWLHHLRSLGAAARSATVPGYEGMMGKSSPHLTLVPDRIIQTAIDWMSRLQAQAPAHRPPSPAVPATDRIVHRGTGAHTAQIEERPVRLDPLVGLFGILSRPPDGSDVRQGMVLLGAGADRRIGASRLYVQLARHWAAEGKVVLRLDISGIGDTPARAGCAENTMHGPDALDDVEAAVRYLRTHHGVQTCHLVGHCAGAYNALRTAIRGAQVDRIVMINPLQFTPSGVLSLSVQGYRAKMLDWSRWRDLLRHRAKLAASARNLLTHAWTTLVSPCQRVVGRMAPSRRRGLAAELIDLTRRGTRVHAIFSRGDAGEDLLRSLVGATLDELVGTGRMTVSHVSGADHMYTRLRERQELFRLVVRLVETPTGEAVSQAQASSAGLGASSLA